jgi:PEP-CTERM motif
VITPGYGSAIDLGAPPIVGFLSGFSENPDVASEYDDLTFDLLSIVAPSVAACDDTLHYAINSQCALGPFTLAQTADGVSIRMDITGQFVDPTYLDGAITSATGIYTAQRADSTIDAMLDLIVLSGGTATFENSYSAQITAIPPTPRGEVPEPATLLTFGAGTALLAAHRRRRAKKNAQA